MATDNTEAKQGGTQFQPGQSGNPKGRPRGSRNATTLALEALLDGEAESLTRKAIELAKAGDMQALKLCMDRIAPPRKDSPVSFALQPMKASGDAVAAMAALVDAVAAGGAAAVEGGGMAQNGERVGAGRQSAHTEEGHCQPEGEAKARCAENTT